MEKKRDMKQNTYEAEVHETKNKKLKVRKSGRIIAEVKENLLS